MATVKSKSLANQLWLSIVHVRPTAWWPYTHTRLTLVVPLVCRYSSAVCCEREHHRAGGHGSVGPRGERMLPTPAGLHSPDWDAHHQGGNFAGCVRRRWGRQCAVRECNGHSGCYHQLQSDQGEEADMTDLIYSQCWLIWPSSHFFFLSSSGGLLWGLVCLWQGFNPRLPHRPESE